MKVCLSLSLVMAATAMLIACSGASSVAEPKELIPANANFIAQVQVGKLLQDADFQSLYDQAPKSSGEPATFDELLQMGQEETGIDFAKFASALLFGDVSQSDEYYGIVAQGQFDEDQLVSAIEESSGHSLETTEYAGQKIYSDPEDAQAPAMAFLGSDTLVLGTLPALQDVVDVHQGNAERISGKVYDSFNALGEPLFSMAMTVPPEALSNLQDSMGGGSGFGMMPALDAFQDLDVVSLVLDKPGSDLKVEATMDFNAAESATSMNNTLDGFLKLAAGFTQDQGLRALMEKLELSVEGTRLTLKFQAPLSEIQEVARSMSQDMSGQY